MPIASIEEGLEEIRNGRMVILVDEDAPDSNGFFSLAAEKVSAQSLNYMMHHGRGIIYVTLNYIDLRVRKEGLDLEMLANSLAPGTLQPLKS